jgi:hypothetical protein
VEGVGPDEAAVAPKLDGVANESAASALATGEAAEDEDFASHDAGVAREVKAEAAGKAAVGEENGLLGKPFEPGAVLGAQVRFDAGGAAGRAVHLLGGLGHDESAGTGAGADGDAEGVAGDQAAAGVDEGGERDVALGRMGPEHAQGGALVEVGEARAAVAKGEADHGLAVVVAGGGQSVRR